MLRVCTYRDLDIGMEKHMKELHLAPEEFLECPECGRLFKSDYTICGYTSCSWCGYEGDVD
jgi:hypothetical protein